MDFKIPDRDDIIAAAQRIAPYIIEAGIEFKAYQ